MNPHINSQNLDSLDSLDLHDVDHPDGRLLEDRLQHSPGPRRRPLPEPGSSRRYSQTAHPTANPYTTTSPNWRPLSALTPTPSEREQYGLDRTFGSPATTAPSYARPVVIEGPYRRVPDIPPITPYHPLSWDTSNAVMVPDFRDELARLEGVVTPGVDDTPYIQYAIEALTRDRESGYSAVATTASGSSSSTRPLGPGQYLPTTVLAPAPAPFPAHPPTAHAPPTSPPARNAKPEPHQQQLLRPVLPNPQASAHSLAESLLKSGPRPAQPHEWRHLERDELDARAGELGATVVPPLTFRPWPLRAPALFAFMALCVLMVAALIFSAVYSHLHQGLWEWAGINGGRYFLFRILPQLLGAAMLLYAQFLATTMFRLLPFIRLASEVQEQRDGALFQDLYLSFLWPRLVGPWNVWVPVLVTWLMNFTIPLQSSLFTVILVDQTWIWATVQGVAWTLVALYLALLVSTIIVWRYWASLESTGLIWDPRSLADIAAIVSETNTADDYRGTQLARGRDGIRFALRRRAADKLGYWTWKDGRPGLWHALGSPLDDANLLPVTDLAAGQRMERHDEKQAGVVISADGPLFTTDHDDHDMEASHPSAQARHRYLPWCLRTSPLLWFTTTTFILILAIFILSFLPSTRIAAGFDPALKADPQPGAFSAADFLFSFLPSLLGLLPFLLFHSLDLNLRVLQPWAALSHTSPASRSLLADYAACGPVQVTFRAIQNRHWRLAVTSLFSTVFILIPVLAGGMFMALTTNATESAPPEVRMFPNMPAFCIVLALLVVFLLALVSLFPGRKELRMPHGVTCLAEVVGFLVDVDLREEEVFKGCLSRREMVEKMGVGKGEEGETRWVFGFGGGAGGAAEGELGVRRVRRFTEKRRVRKSQIRRPLLRRE